MLEEGDILILESDEECSTENVSAVGFVECLDASSTVSPAGKKPPVKRSKETTPEREVSDWWYRKYPVFDYEFRNDARRLPFYALISERPDDKVCGTVPDVIIDGKERKMTFLLDKKIAVVDLAVDRLGCFIAG